VENVPGRAAKGQRRYPPRKSVPVSPSRGRKVGLSKGSCGSRALSINSANTIPTRRVHKSSKIHLIKGGFEGTPRNVPWRRGGNYETERQEGASQVSRLPPVGAGGRGGYDPEQNVAAQVGAALPWSSADGSSKKRKSPRWRLASTKEKARQ